MLAPLERGTEIPVCSSSGNSWSGAASCVGSRTKGPETTISVETALVNLDVLVTDQDGRVLSGLGRENFRLLDNGKPQAITHFEPTSAPITVAMLMEYSGSAYNYFAYKAASWGSNFPNHLDPLVAE